MAMNHSLLNEIGPDGLPREAPVIAYTEKIIEEEQLQLKKYIEEHYSKIRDVEKEFANLSLEMKLTSGPKKAALEHIRRKIETSTEKIRVAKLNEQQTRKVWEAAAKAVKEEEDVKQKLCEDLNRLVQESSNTQFSRLEELKRRLEALNHGNASRSALPELKPAAGINLSQVSSAQTNDQVPENPRLPGINVLPVVNGQNNQLFDSEGKGKKRALTEGKGKGFGAVPKGRGSTAPGWTGAGFNVDGRT